MLPLFVRVHVLSRNGRTVRLWVPLFLLWLLLLPFALVLLPVLFVILIVVDVDLFPAVGGLWHLLCSLSGVHIEVDAPDASIFVQVV
jgi:hypothetical protein